jgi:2-polyprenyl-6-methoxyphenol hydroxylase-like FAD-dependent oxidoreductase
MAESEIAVFDRLVAGRPPERAESLTATACVLGGSIAGLLAARVLSRYANRVVVIDRDAADVQGQPRRGVPQDRQVHVLLPGGLGWMERWLPGLTQDLVDRGAVLGVPEQNAVYADGCRQVTGEHDLLYASRPFLESRIRAHVMARPNVSALSAQASGLTYRGGAVSGVCYSAGGTAQVLEADLVVDAMGRASQLSDWLAADRYDRPRLERLPTAINYTTAAFRRAQRPEDLEVTGSIARFWPPYPADGVAVAAATAIEDDRWLVLLMGYDNIRPGRTLDAFRAACAQLPPVYAQAASGALIGEIATYHQADSRRRHFAGAERLPARLVSVGDAVASFNPIYGQGMSSAALHASCLAEYLSADPALDRPATEFFELQQVVTDAAWAVSAGSDAARLDALSGAAVPDEVRDQRWAMSQIVQAACTDAGVGRAFDNVGFMLAHPATLADPALLARAIEANQAVAVG